MDDLSAFVGHLVAGTPRGYCSEGYLIRRVRDEVLTLGDREVRAAIAVAVTKGLVEYQNHGLNSTDGTPWIGRPREANGAPL